MNNVLVVAAHPDDEVLGCGATIARHVYNGDQVRVVFLADGFSSRESDKDRDDSAEKASKVLGCQQPVFLRFPDNRLDSVSLLEIVQKIEEVIYSYNPSIVYTHHFGDLNVDHKIAHKAVITACRPQPSLCVKEVYSFETLSATHWNSPSMGSAFNPNYFISVGEFIDKKIEALRCYDKEIRDYPHARSYEAVESLLQLRGSTVGLNKAEAFFVERLIK